MHARDTLAHAVVYASDLLRQGAGIAEVAARAGLRFDDRIGPHLRHVIEHYEALLNGLDRGVVDYDNRPRERALERDAALAQSRCTTLVAALENRRAQAWPERVAVAVDGGVHGEVRFVSGSTPLRELLFVAGHAVHHYALLRVLLEAEGLTLPENLGRAAATIRYERERGA